MHIFEGSHGEGHGEMVYIVARAAKPKMSCIAHALLKGNMWSTSFMQPRHPVGSAKLRQH